ncbi:MAG: carboxylating nicotinate-nucleotide diphosphorylase [Alphaproteobacteria bacterium]|nr:carboxylating nicotinate-nucleotide diphosphorylase [Alphaproteobacteria bacterium]
MRRIIAAALAEDLGQGGDITSQLLIPEAKQGRLAFNARQDMVACGLFIPGMVFEQLGAGVLVEPRAYEGEHVGPGTALCLMQGPGRRLLTGERVALNLMQRACAVATLTRRYVEAVMGTHAIILDTRKTMPGLRALDKYAVAAGGGHNHRMGLFDMVLIKDNHIALAGSITAAVRAARDGTTLPVEVECDTLEQVREALDAQPERILLDNMDTDDLQEAVAMSGGRVKLEASGGVNLDTVRAIAETGVDYISVGALTHSALSVDIGADIILD